MPRNQLPDTPWHVGSPRMKEGDTRRLNKWCVHYNKGKCMCPSNGCYLANCVGSSHCRNYVETWDNQRKLEVTNKTQDAIVAERNRAYVESLKPDMEALLESEDDRRFIPTKDLHECLICKSALLELKPHAKQCALCQMIYVDIGYQSSVSSVVKNAMIFVMGKMRPWK